MVALQPEAVKEAILTKKPRPRPGQSSTGHFISKNRVGRDRLLQWRLGGGLFLGRRELVNQLIFLDQSELPASDPLDITAV